MSENRQKLTQRAEELRDQRASVADQLKDVAAELWRDGLENVREIGRLTGLSRTTLYSALRERGIEPTARVAPDVGRLQEVVGGLRSALTGGQLSPKERERVEKALPGLEDKIRAAQAAADRTTEK